MNSLRFAVKVYVVFLMVFICKISYGEVNLLPNPSFEEAGTGTLAAGWYYYHDGYSRSSDFSQEGSWSCKITGTGTANEMGLGGARYSITSGLPRFGDFTVYSNIYIDSYTQGRIYDIYVSVSYTDSTTTSFSSTLSAAEIAANIDSWKSYSYSFSTDRTKTIASIGFWCLVWTEGTDKFIGTVYFDDLKLEVYKPALYWKGDNIYGAANRPQAAADVLSRGFTHALTGSADNYYRGYILNSLGFKVVKSVTPFSGAYHAPRLYSPYNDLTNYENAQTDLATYLSSNSYVTGIADDIEELPFPCVRYSTDGTADVRNFPDLEYRIGNQTPQCSGWPVFKDWPVSGDHDVSNLNIENIEYNFPVISVDNSGTPDATSIIGYYGSGYTYQSYEMAAQTFKPVDSRITRIDVMLRRMGDDSAFPLGNLYYYLTEVDAAGKPDLTKKISYAACTVLASEIDYSYSSWDGIQAISLYFDPVEVGELDTNKQYALVLEFTKKNNDDWNSTYYYAAGFNSNVYNDGQAWRRSNGAWSAYASLYDFWLKIYKPDPPYGFALNQFHEDWIDFQCAVMARYIQDYRDIADSFAPSREIWIYSGYEGRIYPRSSHNYDGVTRRAYSVDWEMLSAAGIDYAVCGYGSSSIDDTINALNAGNPSCPPRLIGGGASWEGETSFIERYNTCDGIMLYYSGYYDSDPGWYIP